MKHTRRTKSPAAPEEFVQLTIFGYYGKQLEGPEEAQQTEPEEQDAPAEPVREPNMAHEEPVVSPVTGGSGDTGSGTSENAANDPFALDLRQPRRILTEKDVRRLGFDPALWDFLASDTVTPGKRLSLERLFAATESYSNERMKGVQKALKGLSRETAAVNVSVTGGWGARITGAGVKPHVIMWVPIIMTIEKMIENGAWISDEEREEAVYEEEGDRPRAWKTL